MRPDWATSPKRPATTRLISDQIRHSRAGSIFVERVFALSMLLVLTVIWSGSAFAQQTKQIGQAPARYDVPKPHVLFVLLRTTLTALDQANKTGNYTVLRDWASPSFRQRNTAARLSEIFARLRKSGADLSATSVVTPELVTPPVVNAQNQLLLAGNFPTLPLHVTFDISFVPVDGQWRLMGLSVGLRPPPRQVSGVPAPSKKKPK